MAAGDAQHGFEALRQRRISVGSDVCDHDRFVGDLVGRDGRLEDTFLRQLAVLERLRDHRHLEQVRALGRHLAQRLVGFRQGLAERQPRQAGIEVDPVPSISAWSQVWAARSSSGNVLVAPERVMPASEAADSMMVNVSVVCSSIQASTSSVCVVPS